MPAKNTPLDSLKNTVLRVASTLEGVGDAIAGSLCSTDHEDNLDWMDSAKGIAWLALAEHVPGIIWNGYMAELTPEALQTVHHYDDGSLVNEWIELTDGAQANYYPRFDGDRAGFIARIMAAPRPQWDPEESPEPATAISAVELGMDVRDLITTGQSGDETTVVIMPDLNGDPIHLSPTAARQAAIRLLEFAHKLEHPVDETEWPGEVGPDGD